jgi:hypothetical protein
MKTIITKSDLREDYTGVLKDANVGDLEKPVMTSVKNLNEEITDNTSLFWLSENFSTIELCREDEDFDIEEISRNIVIGAGVLLVIATTVFVVHKKNPGLVYQYAERVKQFAEENNIPLPNKNTVRMVWEKSSKFIKDAITKVLTAVTKSTQGE